MLAMNIYEKKLVIKDNKNNTGVGSIVTRLRVISGRIAW